MGELETLDSTLLGPGPSLAMGCVPHAGKDYQVSWGVGENWFCCRLISAGSCPLSGGQGYNF
jgi:hypothetical protein